jgi:GT2 family glycosyltransferase
MGVLEIPLGANGIDRATLVQAMDDALGTQILDHLRRDDVEAGDPDRLAEEPGGARPPCLRRQDEVLACPPSASVVVATRDRPDRLARCLDSLLRLEYGNFQVLVVDNRPSTDATATLVRDRYGSDGPVRLVREERPGLAAAHNRGLAEVEGEIIAFTDDDVTVDRRWLAAIATAFDTDKSVGCVTGLIMPLELDTEAQLLAEHWWGYSKGFTRCVFDIDGKRPSDALFPYDAGRFGSGANMAFRATDLRALGGFDPVMGVGTRARGGDDLDAFSRVVRSGASLVYEPDAIVYHQHHRDYEALRRQALGYGVGLTAYLTNLVIKEPRVLPDLVRRVPAGLRQAAARSGRALDNDRRTRRELLAIEALGMLWGPAALLRSRRDARRVDDGAYEARGAR